MIQTRKPLQSQILGYLVAVSAMGLALLVRLLLDPLLHTGLPFLTLFGAVAIAVWFGGYGPALLATIVGYIVSDYLFLEPHDLLVFKSTRDVIILALYLISCCIIIGFGAGMRSARNRYENKANESLEKQRQLEHEIAEREQADQRIAALNNELRHRVEELQSLLDVLPIGVFIAHDSACENITSNPAGAVMLGLDQEANTSKTGPGADVLPFKMLKDGIEVPGDELVMQRAARTGIPVIGEEFQIVRNDGTIGTLYEYAVPLFDELGNVRGCLGAFVDITEQKQSHEEVRQLNQALEHRLAERREAEEALIEVDKRKDEFLATLAHELRNPLAPIYNAVELLRMNNLSESEIVWTRDIIDRQVQHLTRLVDDLLDVSRITRGKIELRRERITIESVVSSALETSRPLIEANNHKLSVNMPDEPLYVDGDLTRLAQAASNLLNNSAKYTRKGGEIALSVERHEDTVLLCILDNGIGIPRDMLSGIFSIFAQADRSLERTTGGLGIGLTISKRLIEMHGGSIEVRSEGIDKGSEFIIRLPMIPQFSPSETEVGNGVQKTLPHRPRRILVADDNRDAADSLVMLLRLQGNEVNVARDGVEAIEIASVEKPEIIVLDVGMPRMNGYETARTIRNQPWGAGILLIAMTGWGREEDKRRATEYGFDYHLTKPVDISELSTLLGELSTVAPAV